MDPIFFAIAGLAGVAAAAAVLGLRVFVSMPQAAVLARVRRVMGTAGEAPPRAAAGRARSWWAALVLPLSGLARPRRAEETSRTRRALSHAGFRGERAADVYYGLKVALGLLLGGGLLAANAAGVMHLSSARSWAVVLAAAGFYAPNVALRRLGRARQTALRHGLADTLDLLVTCLEAGLGLDAAFHRLSQHMAPSAPELAAELRLTTLEIEAGVARADAFRRLADRTGLEELRALASLIIQTEMFGTSVAQTLRAHASAMRTRRTHLAEERGATAGVKMMIPLILCILPSLLAVLLGPAIVRVAALFAPGLRGNP